MTMCGGGTPLAHVTPLFCRVIECRAGSETARSASQSVGDEVCCLSVAGNGRRRNQR